MLSTATVRSMKTVELALSPEVKSQVSLLEISQLTNIVFSVGRPGELN